MSRKEARAAERLTVEAARMRVLDGSEPTEQIAQAVGFHDGEDAPRVRESARPAAASDP